MKRCLVAIAITSSVARAAPPGETPPIAPPPDGYLELALGADSFAPAGLFGVVAFGAAIRWRDDLWLRGNLIGGPPLGDVKGGVVGGRIGIEHRTCATCAAGYYGVDLAVERYDVNDDDDDEGGVALLAIARAGVELGGAVKLRIGLELPLGLAVGPDVATAGLDLHVGVIAQW
ncbi:MAG TPA: hypothetical protein VLX92_12190 [Kofleriaceae bacterium]|nr:hypothetical protein [Kofleriaceae bacterium]